MISEKKKVLAVLVATSLLVLLAMFTPLPVRYNQASIKALGNLSGPFCFAMMGDTHTNLFIFDKLSSKIKYENVSFVIINGDITMSGRLDEYKLMYWGILRLNLPVFANIGNHDIRDNGIASYKKIFGPLNYSFRTGNSKFIFLDSSDFSISSKQYNWLISELSEDVANKFVVSHVPVAELNETFLDVFTEYNVSAVLQSHVHAFSDTTYKNVRYIVTPSAGGSFEVDPDNFGFVKICVADKELKIERVDTSAKNELAVHHTLPLIKPL